MRYLLLALPLVFLFFVAFQRMLVEGIKAAVAA